MYVVATVVLGCPLFSAVAAAALSRFDGSASPGESGAPAAPPARSRAAADALLYAFLPNAVAIALRAAQGRTLLARFGKRTCYVLDVQPCVHQLVGAFASKLFALSFGLASVDVHSANPSDHFVHRALHRATRGTLLALGLPDGLLRALVGHECAAVLAACQAKSVVHWGVGAELVTLGHHAYRAPRLVEGAVISPSGARPRFLSELRARRRRAAPAARARSGSRRGRCRRARCVRRAT